MRVLLLNQAFYPDVVSTAQHLTDLAVRLDQLGHEVTVITGARAYDSPEVRFRRRETWKGIRILRISSLALGKGSRWRRALNFGSFLLNCSWRLLLTPRCDVVMALTSPPLISFLATWFVKLKGGRFVFWVMDLNPDEAVAAGWLREGSLAARLLSAILMNSLRSAEKIVVLDRFMERRIVDKGIAAEKIVVIPPWAQDDVVQYDGEGRAAFRAEHGMSDKFVVMYSGNHSPCHPLDTLLEAARRLKDDARIAFCFVGGGSEFPKIKYYAKEQRLNNILCLPYQPLQKLSASLSSGDLQVVVMGNAFAGIVHPCKIYNILAIGAPVLYVGPAESHISDILAQLGGPEAARFARHGAVDEVVRQVVEAAQEAASPGLAAVCGSAARFSRKVLLPQMVEALESACGELPEGGSRRAPTAARGT